MSSAKAEMESHRGSFNVRRMLDGELYIFDEHNEALQGKAQDLVREFNACADPGWSDEILTELLGSRGESCTMMPTIGFDYGWNTFVGENFYANMGLIVLDVVPVTIGATASSDRELRWRPPVTPLPPARVPKVWNMGSR